MRSGFAFLLTITVLFGSGYWYYTARAICDVPLEYRIGSIDPRFDLSRDEARNVVSAAESLWEDATGRNLFTHDERASMSINFIYDERQEETKAKLELRNELEERESLTDEVRAEYERFLTEYERLREQYEARIATYEANLSAHNQEVEEWNQKGGAPEDVYATLEKRQQELAEEQRALNDLAAELNRLVRKMNAIGEEGNSIVTDYNEIVEEYNNRFHETHEFTQGDFQGDAINIYQFDSTDELIIVLAHEFGHALALDHVPGETSILYHFMEAQSLEVGVTQEDVTEFERVCGERSFVGSVFRTE